MASTSSLSLAPDETLAAAVRDSIIRSGHWPPEALDELLRRALADDGETARKASAVFFRTIVEGLCDLFEPAATSAYAELFAAVVARVLPRTEPAALLDRYRRIRTVRPYRGNPHRVCVLSRVTLGADVAVTSVLLHAAKQRFPGAEIVLAGPPKNLALFAADPRVRPLEISYNRRATLGQRIAASARVTEALAVDSTTLVLDPDSRLSQLGIVPVAPESQYLFFESRAYGGASPLSLPVLAADWLAATLGAHGATPYLQPVPVAGCADITVSLGVGENSEKLAAACLELEALHNLASFGRTMVIDGGAGGEETERVERLVEQLGRPPHVRIHHGSFASFAAQILHSRLYFGYDSAGQHVAAAGAVPLVTVFNGYACERTFNRWRPTGPGPIRVIKVDRSHPSDITEQTRAALTSAAAEAGLA